MLADTEWFWSLNLSHCFTQVSSPDPVDANNTFLCNLQKRFAMMGAKLLHKFLDRKYTAASNIF